MTTIYLGMFAFWAISMLLTILGAILILNKFILSSRTLLPRRRPITILKPLKGDDPDLHMCLESFFMLNFFPGDELVFCVANRFDKSYRTAQLLMSKYPKISSRLICAPELTIPNPKIANIYTAYLQTHNDLILVSDSNVLACPDYLERLDSEFKGGVLTAPSTGQNSRTFSGTLECIYLSTFYAKVLCLGNLLKQPLVVGKSMMFQKSVMEKFGLNRVGHYLAEDYMTGVAMKSLGEKVYFMTEPVVQQIGVYSFSEFWFRHVRWGRMRKAHSYYVYLLEIFYGFIVSGVIGVIAVHGLGYSVPEFILLHTCLWWACDASAMFACGQDISLRNFVVWFCREASNPALWLHIILGREIEWKGNYYTIKDGGEI